MFKRGFSLFLAILIFASVFSISVFSEEVSVTSKDTFWNWAAQNSGDGLLSALISYNVEDVCPTAEDGRHRATYPAIPASGRYQCNLCGKFFDGYITDFQQSYKDQVSALPAQSYNSEGSLLITPYKCEMWAAVSSFVGNTWKVMACPHYTGSEYVVSSSSFLPNFNCDQYYMSVTPKEGNTSFSLYATGAFIEFAFKCPVDGYYSYHSNCIRTGYYIKDGVRTSIDFIPSLSSSPVFRSSGSSFSYTYVNSGASGMSYFYMQGAPLVYQVVPVDDLKAEVAAKYPTTSRPTTITGGNYGIIGDNGQITKVENNNTIVNETNNTYYNPSTGQTTPITEWSYNYEDRSYNVTTESGDTVTITYGDENISITENNTVEGDTITNNYTIYYITNNNGSGDPDDPNSGSSSGSTSEPDKPTKPDPSTCKHEYTLSKSSAPDCKNAGYKIYKCNLCGNDYTETLAALGHDWQVVTETPDVPDTPDTPDSSTSSDSASASNSSSAPTYTLYRCSRCGIEYKDTDGSGPPADKEDGGILGWFKKLFGSLFNGILDVLSSIVGGAIDLICKLIDDLFAGVTHVIDTLFKTLSEIADFGDGFKDFLAAFFSYVPPEIVTLLAFSISLGIILAIIKFFRG